MEEDKRSLTTCRDTGHDDAALSVPPDFSPPRETAHVRRRLLSDEDLRVGWSPFVLANGGVSADRDGLVAGRRPTGRVPCSAGEVGDLRLPLGSTKPPRHLRSEAGRSAGLSGAVSSDCDTHAGTVLPTTKGTNSARSIRLAVFRGCAVRRLRQSFASSVFVRRRGTAATLLLQSSTASNGKRWPIRRASTTGPRSRPTESESSLPVIATAMLRSTSCKPTARIHDE